MLWSSVSFIVYTDFKSPYAYLAKDLIYAMEDELGMYGDWRHFTLDIPSYLGSARVDDRGTVLESTRSEHQWKRVKYAYMDVRRYANLRGMIIRGTQKIWDTSMAGAALYKAKEGGRDVMRRFMDDVFERFWKRELDLEDPNVLAARLDAAGADGGAFDAYRQDRGKQLHDKLRQEAWDIGVFGVPTLRLVDDELFFGREQLPLVRWKLSGSQGPPPTGF